MVRASRKVYGTWLGNTVHFDLYIYDVRQDCFAYVLYGTPQVATVYHSMDQDVGGQLATTWV